MIEEFKKFLLRGNILDLAIAVIIGAAFTKVVTSLTSDVLMPLIGLFLGKVNFTELFVSLNGVDYPTLADAQKAGAPTINYGIFINQVLDFLIVATVIFFIMKAVTRIAKFKIVTPEK